MSMKPKQWGKVSPEGLGKLRTALSALSDMPYLSVEGDAFKGERATHFRSVEGIAKDEDVADKGVGRFQVSAWPPDPDDVFPRRTKVAEARTLISEGLKRKVAPLRGYFSWGGPWETDRSCPTISWSYKTYYGIGHIGATAVFKNGNHILRLSGEWKYKWREGLGVRTKKVNYNALEDFLFIAAYAQKNKGRWVACVLLAKNVNSETCTLYLVRQTQRKPASEGSFFYGWDLIASKQMDWWLPTEEDYFSIYASVNRSGSQVVLRSNTGWHILALPNLDVLRTIRTGYCEPPQPLTPEGPDTISELEMDTVPVLGVSYVKKFAGTAFMPEYAQPGRESIKNPVFCFFDKDDLIEAGYWQVIEKSEVARATGRIPPAGGSTYVMEDLTDIYNSNIDAITALDFGGAHWSRGDAEVTSAAFSALSLGVSRSASFLRSTFVAGPLSYSFTHTGSIVKRGESAYAFAGKMVEGFAGGLVPVPLSIFNRALLSQTRVSLGFYIGEKYNCTYDRITWDGTSPLDGTFGYRYVKNVEEPSLVHGSITVTIGPPPGAPPYQKAQEVSLSGAHFTKAFYYGEEVIRYTEAVADNRYTNAPTLTELILPAKSKDRFILVEPTVHFENGSERYLFSGASPVRVSDTLPTFVNGLSPPTGPIVVPTSQHPNADFIGTIPRTLPLPNYNAANLGISFSPYTNEVVLFDPTTLTVKYCEGVGPFVPLDPFPGRKSVAPVFFRRKAGRVNSIGASPNGSDKG